MREKKYYLLCLIALSTFSAKGQFTLSSDTVLSILQAQQIVEDSFYAPGLFRSQRILGKNSYEDNSLYYSTLIATTLDKLSSKVPPKEIKRVNQIVAGVKQNAYNYKSRKQRSAFNFWPTNPDVPHPNGPTKYQTGKFRLPDDFDDTSMIGLLLNDDSLSKSIRQEMIDYTQNRKKKVKTTYKEHKRSEAYGVWFADRWVQEFDICVLANTLLFVFENDFKLNQYESASISLVKDMASQYLNRRKFFVISPYYPEKPVILYHLARLLAADNHGSFSAISAQIKKQVNTTLRSQKLSSVHKLMLYNSLMRLGEYH